MTNEPTHLLSMLCALPLLAALVVLFTPRQAVRSIRGITLTSMLGVFGLSLCLLRGDYSTAAMQFAERHVLVPSHGITYSLGVDGMSLWLVILTAFITPLAAFASWTHIDTKLKEYAISLLVLEGAIIGAFVALDLLLFYTFWELTLVPVCLIIGMWGDTQRLYAALKLVLYTMAGSVLMLVGIIYLVAQYREQTGHYSFELRDLQLLLLPVNTQLWLFLAFAAAFAIKVPLVPLHTWLPDAYVQAPTAGSVMLSAVMAKMATYGFLRFAMPLFPSGSHRASATLAMLAVIGVIYGAYCAMAQSDIKKLIAYSSVSHLGFVMLGIYTLSADGVRGSILQMVNHGISTGALFLLVGVIYERRKTRNMSELGGLAKVMPAYTAIFVVVMLSSIGVPITNGFVGEFMIIGGAMVSEMLGRHGPLAAGFAATALIFTPMVILHAVRKTFWGPLKNPANRGLADLSLRERAVFAPIVLLIFYIGLFPNQMLRPMSASVDRFALEYVMKLRAGDRNPDSRGLLGERPASEGGEPEDQPRGSDQPLSATLPRGF